MKSWTRLLKRWFRPQGIGLFPPRRQQRPRLLLELLETRLVPAALTVNSLADTVSGTAATLDLREAILLVNSGGTASDTSGNSLSAAKAGLIDTTTAFGSNDTIQFAASLSGQTITLGSALPSLSSNVAIVGPGATSLSVSGAGQFQVFVINYGVTVVPYASISGLTIENGFASGSNEGGGVYNAGILTLSNCAFSGNSGYGGGIFNDGTLTVNNCSFSHNSSSFDGGGIFNDGTLTVTGSTFSHNSSGRYGGGMSNEDGYLTVDSSTFSDNTAAAGGGVFWSDFNGSSMTVANSTLAGNSAANQGGGICYFESSEDPGQGGPGLLTNVTIAKNTCNTSGSLGSGGGGIWAAPGHLTLNNTIVADNFNGPSPSTTADDIAGYVGGADNLIGTGGSGSLRDRIADPFNANQVGVADPGLAPLAGNGGTTQTIALQPGSPAIGAGSKDLAVGASGNPLTTDQRGPSFPRTYNGTVDIGAFESQLAPPRVALTVTNTNDSGPGSLRQCVQDNNLLGGGNTITFAIPTTDPGYNPATGLSTVTLTGGELFIWHDLTVSGPGANRLAVSGDNASRVFEINLASSASISGVTIENGNTQASIHTGDSGFGGGICNFGTLTVSDCTLSGNSAGLGGSGGGICNFGTLTVSNCSLSGNSASSAAGFGGSGGGIDNDGTLTVSNCTFSANSAASSGGGISNSSYSGTLTVSNCTLSGNSAADGGGISDNGMLTVSNCTLSGNSAASSGGGITYFNPFRVSVLTNVTIVDNTCNTSGSGGSGGGIWLDPGSAYFTLNNTIVADNFNGPGPSTTADDIAGALFGRDNLIGTGGSGGLQDRSVDPADGNQVGVVNPGLAPLGDFGGPTQTMALLPGSPAIDAGSNVYLSGFSNTNPLTTDQRGFARVANGTVDIGAFESQPVTFTVTGTSGPGALQQYVQDNNLLGGGNTILFQTSATTTPATVIQAVNALTNVIQPVGITLAGSGGTFSTNNIPYQPSDPTTAQNVTSTFIGFSFDPNYPALTVGGGHVIVRDCTLITTGNAPTILVTGGSLKLRNDVVQESTAFPDAALAITGGTVDLGTAADPGGNTVNVNGTGTFLRNTTSIPVTAVGDNFTVNGQALTPSSMSGLVWEDFNDDGQVDFREKGISGVTVTLTGTDDLGNPVNLTQQTDSAGSYLFLNLRPGNYYLTEIQPAGYLQGIDTVGTAGGSLVAADHFFVSLAPGANGLNYNFGERPAATGPVHEGQTAGIGFWNNKKGQTLIKALNGGPTSTQLANWLAATLPHMFGVNAGSANLTGKTNADVAALFQADFLLKGVKLDAQVLATALSVYVTNASLDPTKAAAAYGFTVSGDGVGTAAVNVGSNGDAFGVANNTKLSVLVLLRATDAQAVKGVLYGGNATLRKHANDVYSDLNEDGNDD